MLAPASKILLEVVEPEYVAVNETAVERFLYEKRSGDKKVIFRRDGERYIVFLDDDRIGFVRRTDNGTWNHVDTTMAHPGYAKTRERAAQLLCRRYERMVREGAI
jgi:hypothetical protein